MVIKKPINILLLFLSVALIIGILLFFMFRQTNPTLEVSEIESRIETQYGAIPYDIRLEDGVYYALIDRADGTYEIELNENTGAILSFNPVDSPPNEQPVEEDVLSEAEARLRILELAPADAEVERLTFIVRSPPVWKADIDSEAGDGEIEINAISGEEQSNTFSEGTSYISIERATDIALAEVAGVVEDVDLEELNGRMIYEIEIENEETEEDVTVIIDATTGQIIQFEY